VSCESVADDSLLVTNVDQCARLLMSFTTETDDNSHSLEAGNLMSERQQQISELFSIVEREVTLRYLSGGCAVVSN